ncbi:MAG: exo-alpha-sialidase [Clostridia bacterium]|nr:exo-alpha-sialidase [Clostridia bacterium]
MKKIVILAICGLLLLGLIACNSKDTNKTTASLTTNAPTTSGTGAEQNNPSISLEGYKVIRATKADSKMIKAAAHLKNAICDNVLDDVKVGIDEIRVNETYDPTLKEILIGETNREESIDAFEYLKTKANESSYIIKVYEHKIVIVGTDDNATYSGMKYFINNFVDGREMAGTIEIASDYEFVATNVSKKYFLDDFTEIDISLVSTVYGPSRTNKAATITYAKVLCINHDENNLGTLIATCEGLDKETYGIHRSTDGGKTWEYIADVKEQLSPSTRVANWQPSLYELPCDVGDMKKGTLLLAGCSRDRSTAKETVMTIWKSSDCGETWKQFTIVDQGGALDHGMYEPFLLCDDDGRLVCFYSDETEVDDVHGQRLVFKVSEDGKKWGEKQYIVKPDNKVARPGMVSVTKMGNGKYFAVYEILNIDGQPYNKIHFKTSDSLTSWDETDMGKVLTADGNFLGSAPWCVWTPAGGECGTLFVTASYMNSGTKAAELFVSTDYGNTWEVISNPLPYTKTDDHRMAYSPGFALGSDGTVYYVNDVNTESTYSKKADLKIAVLKIN